MCHVEVSKPNRNSLWGFGRSHGKVGGTPSQAAADGVTLQMPKAFESCCAAFEAFKMCPNVPRSSFEAQ